MRFAFLLSGAGGFFLVIVVGLASGRDLDLVLRDASVACLGCAFVGRWFWRGLEAAFAHTLVARRAAAEAAEAETATAAPEGASLSAPLAAPARAAVPANKSPVPAKAPARTAEPISRR